MRTPLALILTLLGLALAAPAADAETYTVETTGDTSGNPADCTMPAGTCTLRAAIVASSSGDTIVLGPGTYDNTGNDFTIGIGKQVSITGAGARSTVVREVSGGDGRVFLVEDGSQLQLTGLSVTGSRSTEAVLLFGLDNGLTGTRVAFSGNTGGASGGAIDAADGTVTLSDSTVSGNSATGSGGGIFVDDGTLSLTNTTVTGNSAPGGSGVQVDGGQATLTSTTLFGNSGSADLGVGAAPSVARLAGTIVGACSGGAPASLGFNLDAGGSCGLAGQGDRTGDPLLGELADNGGDTDTMALGAASPALDAGGGCPPPAADQRGVARPQGTACDIGAFELEQTAAPAAVLSRLRVRRMSRRAFRISFRLDRAARVRVAVQRCVRRRGGRCARWKRVRTFSKAGRAGRNRVRMRARGLRGGRHRVVARPKGGRAKRRAFRVR